MTGTYWTYMVLCRDGSLYVGATSDLKRRMREHASPTPVARSSKYVLRKGFKKLVYFELYDTHQAAFDREYQIKHWSGEDHLSRRRLVDAMFVKYKRYLLAQFPPEYLALFDASSTSEELAASLRDPRRQMRRFVPLGPAEWLKAEWEENGFDEPPISRELKARLFPQEAEVAAPSPQPRAVPRPPKIEARSTPANTGAFAILWRRATQAVLPWVVLAVWVLLLFGLGKLLRG